MHLVKALGVACVVGLLAQVRLPLPFSPVPITAQTIGVLLAGVMLGPGWGGASLVLYLAMGWGLLPWFAGFTVGLTPTGGYLIGFALAATLVGFATRRYGGQSWGKLAGIMLAGSLLIYLPGVTWLYFWLGGSIGLGELMVMGILPFLPGDIIKSVATAALARVIVARR